MLRLTTTLYTRVEVPVTRYVVNRYRVVSRVVTRLDVDYYDDRGAFWTRISYPTQFLKDVFTEFLTTYERVERPGAGKERPVPQPVPVQPTAPLEEKVGARVAT